MEEQDRAGLPTNREQDVTSDAAETLHLLTPFPSVSAGRASRSSHQRRSGDEASGEGLAMLLRLRRSLFGALLVALTLHQSAGLYYLILEKVSRPL